MTKAGTKGEAMLISQKSSLPPEWQAIACKALDEGRLHYRVTDENGEPCNGGSAAALPLRGWSKKKEPIICQSGWHLTDSPHRWAGSRVWLVEGMAPDSGVIFRSGDKTCWPQIRVLGEVDPTCCLDPSVIARCASGRSADLQGANLRYANLRYADLRGACIRDANLCGTDLSHADLRGADLRGADLSYAYLRGADLRGANLRGTNLRDADLYGANLRDADLRGADLRDANLCGADLRGADLGGADLRGACIRDAKGLQP